MFNVWYQDCFFWEEKVPLILAILPYPCCISIPASLPPVSVVIPLQAQQFSWELRFHPNWQQVDFVLDGIHHGFKLDLSHFQFYPQCLDASNFWLKKCAKLNFRKLFECSRTVSIICTDVCEFACRGHYTCFIDKEFELFYKVFSSVESTLDSNGRELHAILYSLESFKSHIQGKVVKLFTDSKNAACHFRLQCQPLEIVQFWALNNLSFETEWVPRSFRVRFIS